MLHNEGPIKTNMKIPAPPPEQPDQPIKIGGGGLLALAKVLLIGVTVFALMLAFGGVSFHQ